MKILLSSKQEIPHEGGLSTHMEDLHAALLADGHAVELVHGGQTLPGLPSRLLMAAGALGRRDVYLKYANAAQVRRLAGRIARAIGAFKPDLLHCHDVFAAAAADAARTGARLPTVQTVHGPALYEARSSGSGGAVFHAWIRDCERQAFAAADRFIAVDSGQAQILRNDYDVPGDKITVIFNSVNVAELRELTQAQPTLEAPEVFFLVPRRLHPKTGVRFAIEAMAKLDRPDVSLLIAGDGPQRGQLEARTAELGLDEKVRFLGSVPRGELIPLFSRARGVLVPSVPEHGVVEATSLAVMEAMACGSVPIASNIGGLAELIEHDRTGLLVPPGDPAALAEALRRVLDEPQSRDRLVQAAGGKVEADYSTDAWLAKTVAVYQLALST